VRTPAEQPERQPAKQPAKQPVKQPAKQPAKQPERQPAKQPERQPERQPAKQPEKQPERQPDRQPDRQPERQPEQQPERQPDRQPDRQPEKQPEKQPEEKPAVRYDWGLPTSDTSVTGNDGPAYNSLRRGCDEGAAYLREAWFGFRSPRNVLLFAAGVDLCRGDRQGGARYFEAARTRYGLDGLQPEGRAECDVYKSVRSVLEQQPRDAFPCPGGTPPPYRRGPGGEDNPLTFDVDESAATATPSGKGP
jgi:hypothetical protein